MAAMTANRNNINALYRRNPCGDNVLRNQTEEEEDNWIERNIGGLLLGVALGVVGMIVWQNWQKKRR